MKIVYYTNVSYVDFALEIINELKKHVELHLVIELAPENSSGTIISTYPLDGKPVISDPAQILMPDCYQNLKPYFEGCASVQFYVQTNKRTFTPDIYFSARKLWSHLKKVKADIFHFDTVTQRSLGLIPFLYLKYRKKLVIAIHDPVAHTNEVNWRFKLTNSSYFPLAAAFLLYSNYSKQIFDQEYSAKMYRSLVLKMKPYLSYRRYLKSAYSSSGTYILFFGRISYYKGVETFLQAIPYVLRQFPDQKFLLAGSNFPGYAIDPKLVDPIRDSLILKNYFIPHDELVNLIQHAAFVVCPYKEATQSGVLMTAYACSRSVVATRVGAFSEYITDGVTGKLCDEGNPELLAEAMVSMLRNDSYKEYNDRVHAETNKNSWSSNMEDLLGLYNSILK